MKQAPAVVQDKGIEAKITGDKKKAKVLKDPTGTKKMEVKCEHTKTGSQSNNNSSFDYIKELHSDYNTAMDGLKTPT